MQQYARFKQRHPDCVLLLRMGDFYETFDDDAVTLSKALGLTLTQRTQGVPMAGVPYHQLENYLKRLVAQGFRVAVGEQLQDASQAKGLVPRAVTRVVTPGTIVDESLQDEQSAGTLAAVVFTAPGDDSPASLAVVDAATGEFLVTDATAPGLLDELARRGVRELLYADPGDLKPPPRVKRVLDALGLSGTPRPAWQFRPAESRESVLTHFGVQSLAGFGLREDDPAIAPAGAILRYLTQTQTLSEEDLKSLRHLPGVTLAKATLKHLRPPRREDPGAFVVIDAVSLRSLEIERTLRASPTADGSLLGVFLGHAGRGLCRTAMGKRLLRDWLCRPLRDAGKIRARQQIVEHLIASPLLAGELSRLLGTVQDVARIAGRLALGRATPRDLVAVARSAAAAKELAVHAGDSPPLASFASRFGASRDELAPTAQRVLEACVDDPPPHLREGGLIKDGIDPSLDEARLLQRDAGAWLAAYQARLIAQHNLPSLRVGFNKIVGYYIELPQAQARAAPPELIRAQTLKNAERFTTPELREFERKVTTAEARAAERERELFDALAQSFVDRLAGLAAFADAVAELDALLAFAEKALRRGWVRPTIVDEPVLDIVQGRHPVLDELLDSRFVPNDAGLGGAHAALALITGPNMAGKSTFIRQTALLTLLAHTGSFIPAASATLGVVDRIFTRIGADDALHAGQSTFMVEMIETANILHHASPSSLVVLDEVGRGTSTLDGLSLAWAIVEHLAREGKGPRTLFATHYHELTDLEDRLRPRVKNLHVEVREWPPGDPHAQIIFLHRILPGRTDQSYGVHVARLAGIPAGVVARAREVLSSLAVEHGPRTSTPAPDAPAVTHDPQLSLFTHYLAHPALDALREVKLDALSPLQAFDELRRLKGLISTDTSPS
jgi:DNA mismatch repair protein MutS